MKYGFQHTCLTDEFEKSTKVISTSSQYHMYNSLTHVQVPESEVISSLPFKNHSLVNRAGINGIERNENDLILPTPIPSNL